MARRVDCVWTSFFAQRLHAAGLACTTPGLIHKAYELRRNRTVGRRYPNPATLRKMTIADALHVIVNHRGSLRRDEARTIMEEILTGAASDAQVGALLVALQMKGESVEEI